MIFICINCEKNYQEDDEDQIFLGQAGCEMSCSACARKIFDNANIIYIKQPERSKREDIYFDK